MQDDSDNMDCQEIGRTDQEYQQVLLESFEVIKAR